MKNIWKQKTEFILIAHNYLFIGAVHKKLGACAGQQPPSESAGSEELLQCDTGKTSSRARLISISQAAYTHRPEQQNYRKAWDVLSLFAYSLRSLSVHACHSVTFTFKVKVTEIQNLSEIFRGCFYGMNLKILSWLILELLFTRFFRNLTFPWVQGHWKSNSSDTFSRSNFQASKFQNPHSRGQAALGKELTVNCQSAAYLSFIGFYVSLFSCHT